MAHPKFTPRPRVGTALTSGRENFLGVSGSKSTPEVLFFNFREYFIYKFEITLFQEGGYCCRESTRAHNMPGAQVATCQTCSPSYNKTAAASLRFFRKKHCILLLVGRENIREKQHHGGGHGGRVASKKTDVLAISQASDAAFFTLAYLSTTSQNKGVSPFFLLRKHRNIVQVSCTDQKSGIQICAE